ncbi:MAG: carbohydrate kinase family protein [Betaproteobacteria bacterium]
MSAEERTMEALRRIGIVGNLEVDLVLGPLGRLPDWGEERVVTYREVRAAGSAGYTALALGHLGHRPLLLGPVGDDPEGQTIRRALTESGLSQRGLVRTPESTGLSVTLIREDGERCFVNHLGGLVNYGWSQLERFLPELFTLDLVLLSGYFLLPALRGEPTARLFTLLREHGVQTALDVGDAVEGWTDEARTELRPILEVTDWFFPNRNELVALSGIQEIDGACSALLASGVGEVVVKLGPEGALAVGWSGSAQVPAFPVTVVDTVGAGDSFNAGFLAGWAEGLALEDCLRLASAVAAAFISTPNRSFPTRDQVRQLLQAHI